MVISSSATVAYWAGTRQRRRVALAILICLNAIYFFAYFQRVAVPGTVFNEIQASFNIKATQVAALAAIYLYLYGGVQLFVGMLIDRFGAFRMALLGGVLLSIGALTFPLSQTLPMLYATRALVGLGASLIFLCVVKGVDVLFAPIYFPVVLAISQAAGNCGGLVGTLPFERAVNAWGWERALLYAGVLTVLTVVVSAVLFAGVGVLRGSRTRESAPLVVGAILRNRYSWPMLIAGPLNFGLYFLVQATIGKKFLTDYCHLSSQKAATFTFLMMLVTMTICVIGAMLTRLFGDRRKPLIVASIGFTGLGVATLLLALHLGLSSGWFLLGYLLMGFSSIGSALGNAVMKELNPPEAIGTAVGALNSMSYIVVAALTSVAGVIMDRLWAGQQTAAGVKVYPKEAYATIFLVCLGISLVSFLVSLTLRETHGRSLFADRTPVAKA